MKVFDSRNPAEDIVRMYQINGKTNTESDKPVNSANASTMAPEEKVSLSSKVQDVQKIKEAVQELPDIREEKVETLKNQIKQGTYDINAEEIAQKMVGESLLDIMV
ncbi:MAG: flagellar biosynthesis anti-sigma factor FlgM [Planctomycetaceae bacterium]|nr:MAG: flagellar biosynthesis anti-sigma factor FlgM [Planctomycetaceae bacterium]